MIPIQPTRPTFRIRDLEAVRNTEIRSGYNNQVTSPGAGEGAGESLLDGPSARRALAGFALSGLLAALPGAILPAWGYHLKFEFTTVGHYFLSMTAGVLLSVVAGRRLYP